MKKHLKLLVALLSGIAIVGAAEAKPLSYILTQDGGTITLTDAEEDCGVGWFAASQSSGGKGTSGCWSALDGSHVVVLWHVLPQKITVPVAYLSEHFKPLLLN